MVCLAVPQHTTAALGKYTIRTTEACSQQQVHITVLVAMLLAALLTKIPMMFMPSPGHTA
jgi:hypothetical protein